MKKGVPSPRERAAGTCDGAGRRERTVGDGETRKGAWGFL